MDARLQKRVQRYGWDAAVPAYETGWSAGIGPGHDALLAALAPAPGERVLEVACGTGLVTRRLAAAVGPTGRVLATDIAQGMIEATAAACADLSQVETARMDAEALDLPDVGFDAAACALGLMYTPDPVAALREIRRALRPGGRVGVLVWGARHACGWAKIFPIVDAEVRSEVCPMFFGLGAPGALEAAFAAAGFEVARCERLSITLTWPDADLLLSAVVDGGAVAMAAKRFSPEASERVRARFLASVAAHRDEAGGYAIPGEYLVGVARRHG